MFFNRPRCSSYGDLTQNPDATQINEPQQTNPEWQRVPILRTNKRRRTSISPPAEVERPSSNRYGVLPLDATEVVTQVKGPSKPPPLILYGIDDVTKLTETIESVLDPNDYNFKIITKNQLRVNCKTTEPYRKLMALVREKGLIGHTFTRKEERCYRIVIRHLHHTTPDEEIVKAISATGNKVIGEIINARTGPQKIPTSTFFVNLEPSPNNNCVKDIKYIYHTAVTIEDPKRRNTVPQCTRCQQYGHTKNNCSRPFRCVKCALSHKTSDCPKKDRNTPAKCALCSGSHPANFKGCQVYREIHNRKFNKVSRTVLENRKDTTKTAAPIIPIHHHSEPRSDSNTYADVTKRSPTQQSTYATSVEDLLIKQSEKIEALLQQISSMMSLIVKLVDRLSP